MMVQIARGYEHVLAWALAACLLTCSALSFAQSVKIVDVPANVKASGDGFVVDSGDIVRVTVFQNPDLAVETRVDGSGRMTYPFLGTLEVRGKTPGDVEKMIATGLEEKQVLKRPQVTVNVTQFRSQQISVLGHVNRPGKFPLELPYTISDALALAGGITPNGADFVVLSREENGAVRNFEIDVLQMFATGGKRADDVTVRAGDVLYVHRAPTFYIYGEVQRPGQFRLERDMTVLQALSAGGGLTPRGTQRGIRITRKGSDGQPVELRGELTGRVEADDVIRIQESLF